VSFAPGRIRLRLRLGKTINNFSDPSISIDASFGLAVHDGTLVAIAEQISVDVSVPWYAWLVPGAFPALAIALDGAREDAKKGAHDMIQGAAQVLNFFSTPPLGKRLSTVRVDAGNNGETTACTNDLLVRYADLSGIVVVG
jgi:hypothetical protein